MFSNFFLKSFRILLLPFAVLYWLAITVRNKLYDKKIFKSTRFGLPLICVGNLSVGGTGKSPMVEYLVELLQSRYEIAILSRGYKRKTSGYALASAASTALDIGDEPMQFHTKFPGVAVAVGEERLVAIPQLLHDRPGTQAIILDDAFQHRAIEAGLNIVLTDYGNLYTRDFYLPTGDLRDNKSSAERAQIIVVTKCKPGLDETEKQKIRRELALNQDQQLFFTTIEYGNPYHLVQGNTKQLDEHMDVLLVTGIANPRPLKVLLEETCNSYHMSGYPDHHIFTIDDLKEIKKRFEQLSEENRIIITTEKDAMRLKKFQHELASLPIYVIPVKHQFLFGEGYAFNEAVIDFISNFKKPV